jgi:hypothetical protein
VDWDDVASQGHRWSSRLPLHCHPPVAQEPKAPTPGSESRLQDGQVSVKTTAASGSNSSSTQHCRCPVSTHHFPLLTRPSDLPMFLQSEDFTKLLQLRSLRNGSRLLVNMAIMRKATWTVYHCRSWLDRWCRRLNSSSDWLMDKGPTPKPLTDGNT